MTPHLEPNTMVMLSKFPFELRDYIVNRISKTHIIRWIREFGHISGAQVLILSFEYDGPPVPFPDSELSKRFGIEENTGESSSSWEHRCKDGLLNAIKEWYERLPISKAYVPWDEGWELSKDAASPVPLGSPGLMTDSISGPAVMTPIADTLKSIKEEIESRGDYQINVSKLVDVMFKLGIIEAKED